MRERREGEYRGEGNETCESIEVKREAIGGV